MGEARARGTFEERRANPKGPFPKREPEQRYFHISKLAWMQPSGQLGVPDTPMTEGKGCTFSHVDGERRLVDSGGKRLVMYPTPEAEARGA